MIRAAIKNGVATYGGKGDAIFTHINVKDCIRAYITILDAIIDGKVDVTENPYFIIAEDEEHQWKSIADRIGRELASRKVIKEAEAKSSGPRPDFYGNYRARSDRLRSLGWKPVEKLSVLDSIPLDVDVILS